jgi:hypothetical protein
MARWVTAGLADYNARREEVLAGQKAQQQTITLGGVALTIVGTAAFHVWDERLLATWAFLAVIPLVCFVVIAQWAAQTTGIKTFGPYLRDLEEKLRCACDAPSEHVLRWEEYVAARSRRLWRHEGIAVAALVPIMWASIGLGAYKFEQGGQEVTARVVSSLWGVLLTVGAVGLMWQAGKPAPEEKENKGTVEQSEPSTAPS